MHIFSPHQTYDRPGIFLLSLLLIIFMIPNSISAQGIVSQNAQPETTQAEADSLSRMPFPLVGITRELGATERLLDQSGQKDLNEEVLDGISGDVDSLIAQVDLFLEQPVLRSMKEISSRELDQLALQNQFYSDQVDGQMKRLTGMAADLENQMLQLQVNGQRWRLTMEQGAGDPTLEARSERLAGTLQRMDEVRRSLQEDLVFVLEKQDHLNAKKTQLDELISRLKEQQAALGETLFRRDVPGFFKDVRTLGDRSLLASHWREFKGSFNTDLMLLKSGYKRNMITSMIVLVALLVFTQYFRKRHSQWIAEERFALSKQHLVFINFPVASALFLLTVMVRLLIPDLPRTFYTLNLLLMMIPMAILMVRVYGSVFRTWVIVLVVLSTVNMLYELSYHPGAMLRILLLALSLAGIWLFAWILKKRPLGSLIKHKFVYRAFRTLLVVFLSMEVLAIFANLAGTFQLAEFLALIPLHITIAAIAIEIASILGETILYLILASNYVQKLNVVRDHFQVIYRKAAWLLNFILLLVFVSLALYILRISEPV